MSKCDVCGKNTLMPERFGNKNICKICFLKVNGPFWKRTYDKYEDAVKYQAKTVEIMRKNNYPQEVVESVNDFFEVQMSTMSKCDCCSKPVQHLQSLGKARLCKNCFGKINNSAWKETEYEDNAHVEKNRNKILKIAEKQGFSRLVVEEINVYFDSKIDTELICSVSSDCDQRLKVYNDYAVLITDEQFDVEEISKAYGKALKSTQPRENLITNKTAKSLARSVLSGGIVQAGISLATSVAIDAAADIIAPNKGTFKVIKGKYRIEYDHYEYAEYQKCGENEVGFIRFANSRSREHLSEDIVFFFDWDDKKYDILYQEISVCMKAARQKKLKESNKVVSDTNSQTEKYISTADEILKFKQLLDMGVITQDEFDLKKKELLGM